MNPGKGVLEFESTAPDLPETVWPQLPARDDFTDAELAPVWNFLRTPRSDFWSLSEHPGFLRLRLKPERLSEIINPSYVGRRQQHLSFRAAADMTFTPATEGEAAGIVLLQNADWHFRYELRLEAGEPVLQLIERRGGSEQLLASMPYSGDKVQLKVEAKGQDYSFSYRASESNKWNIMYGLADGRVLSTDLAGGFTGAYLGMYASSQGADSANYADFDWFSYEGLE
ncbi:Beta-xylosidase [compost metagenome]